MQIAAFIARSRSRNLVLLFRTSSTLVSFSVYNLQDSISDLDYFLKQLLIFYCLTIPPTDEERERDLRTFVDEEEGDIDDESDVELDLDLDLDLDSEQNDEDLESDSLLSDSVDRAGSAEEFQNRS